MQRQSETPEIYSLMEAPAPAVSTADAVQILVEDFGMRAAVQPLAGERDRTFRVQRDGHPDLVLKVTNSSEAPEITNLQTEALLHLQKSNTGPPTPLLIPSRRGSFELAFSSRSGERHVVRLMSFLEGSPARGMPKSRQLRASLSRALAKLDIALGEFEHRAANHELLWNVSKAQRVSSMLPAIEDGEVRGRCAQLLQDFENTVVPRLADLRAQVIHNDFNDNNVLIGADGAVSGVIDFGDMIHAPLVCELGTAAAYQVIDVPDPLEALMDMAHAFTQVLPLTLDEIDILPDLTKARLAMIIVISQWRANRHSTNAAYILRNTASAIRALSSLESIDPHEVRRAIRSSAVLEGGR